MWVGLRPATTRLVQFPRPKQLQAPFNACELAPVKVMLQGADHGLDVAADPPELADRLLARPAVARRPLEQPQRLAGPLQGGGDLFGVGGNPRAALLIERRQRRSASSAPSRRWRGRSGRSRRWARGRGSRGPRDHRACRPDGDFAPRTPCSASKRPNVHQFLTKKLHPAPQRQWHPISCCGDAYVPSSRCHPPGRRRRHGDRLHRLAAPWQQRPCRRGPASGSHDG